MKGDIHEADRKLAEGLTAIFAGLCEAPTGIVQEIDETGPGFVRLSVQAEDGIGETWLLRFAPGEPFEIVQLG